jgi:ubiquitin carboxyl-terminal hydrolase 16/45
MCPNSVSFSPIFSFVDKGSTLYRLAGVVEHIGKDTLKSGHYIAYVRARRLGNQQEGSSCSSSWFRADDCQIRQVTLEQVLNCEAYILFYERMEDQDISGMPEVPEDTFSSWEMIQSDEVVNCNPDLEGV